MEQIVCLEKSQVRRAIREAMSKCHCHNITPDVADIWAEIEQLPEYTLPIKSNKPDFTRNKRAYA